MNTQKALVMITPFSVHVILDRKHSQCIITIRDQRCHQDKNMGQISNIVPLKKVISILAQLF